MLINCLKKYYIECALSNDFDRITNCEYEHNLKEKINKLINYYKDNKKKFKKKLIFVIDEVDRIDDNLVIKISSSVRENLDARTFMKLICIRPSTLKKHNKDISKQMDQFFPKPYFMPKTPLYKIVKYRINMQTNGGINPFSIELCDLMDELFDGNKRDGLGTLESILENTLPKGLHEKTSEEFIQKYLFNVSINYLIDSGKLPNLHDDYFRNIPNYPIVVDLIMSIEYQSSIKLLFGIINDISVIRSRKANILNSNRILKLISDNFNFTLEKMIKHDIVEYVNSNSIKLTTKGSILLEYVKRDHYHKKCKTLISRRKINNTYWQLLKYRINHEEICFNYQSWRDAYKKN